MLSGLWQESDLTDLQHKYVSHQMNAYQTAGDDPVLQKLLHSAITQVQAAEGSILLLADQGQSLEFALSESPVAEKLIGLHQPLDKGITGLAFTLQQPMIVNDVGCDASFDPTVQNHSGVETRSIMVVPLVSPEAEYGAVTAINSKSGCFTESDLTAFGESSRLIVERLDELDLSLPSPNDGSF